MRAFYYHCSTNIISYLQSVTKLTQLKNEVNEFLKKLKTNDQIDFTSDGQIANTSENLVKLHDIIDNISSNNLSKHSSEYKIIKIINSNKESIKEIAKSLLENQDSILLKNFQDKLIKILIDNKDNILSIIPEQKTNILLLRIDIKDIIKKIYTEEIFVKLLTLFGNIYIKNSQHKTDAIEHIKQHIDKEYNKIIIDLIKDPLTIIKHLDELINLTSVNHNSQKIEEKHEDINNSQKIEEKNDGINNNQKSEEKNESINNNNNNQKSEDENNNSEAETCLNISIKNITYYEYLIQTLKIVNKQHVYDNDKLEAKSVNGNYLLAIEIMSDILDRYREDFEKSSDYKREEKDDNETFKTENNNLYKDFYDYYKYMKQCYIINIAGKKDHIPSDSKKNLIQIVKKNSGNKLKTFKGLLEAIEVIKNNPDNTNGINEKNDNKDNKNKEKKYKGSVSSKGYFSIKKVLIVVVFIVLIGFVISMVIFKKTLDNKNKLENIDNIQDDKFLGNKNNNNKKINN